MKIEEEITNLRQLLEEMPSLGLSALGGSGAPLYVLDFIFAGAVKRTLSLGYGLLSMVEAKNMTCGRALVRMQIDTVSRLSAYSYVENPEEMASEIIGGTQLKKFKTKDGSKLTDAYLIDRMSTQHEWVRGVYDSTSGDIHFSEKQFFSSISSMVDDENGKMINLQISQFDTNYPESSWSETVACFSELCEILKELIGIYSAEKSANRVTGGL